MIEEFIDDTDTWETTVQKITLAMEDPTFIRNYLKELLNVSHNEWKDLKIFEFVMFQGIEQLGFQEVIEFLGNQ
jgi:hypothetical protein